MLDAHDSVPVPVVAVGLPAGGLTLQLAVRGVELIAWRYWENTPQNRYCSARVARYRLVISQELWSLISSPAEIPHLGHYRKTGSSWSLADQTVLGSCGCITLSRSDGERKKGKEVSFRSSLSTPLDWGWRGPVAAFAWWSAPSAESDDHKFPSCPGSHSCLILRDWQKRTRSLVSFLPVSQSGGSRRRLRVNGFQTWSTPFALSAANSKDWLCKGTRWN